MSILKRFIEDNGLDFTGSGSELNSNYCIISGFALFKGLTYRTFMEEMLKLYPLIDVSELGRVFEFAGSKHYEKKWINGDYKTTYVYEDISL